MKIRDWFKENYKIIIFLISLLIFVLLLEDVFTEKTMKNDIRIYEFVSKNFMNDSSTIFFKIITNLSGVFFIGGLTILLVMFIRNKKLKFAIPLNLVLVVGLNSLLKNIIQRPRPNNYRIIDESGFSFPSGHSMVSVAFYGFLIYLIYKYINNKTIKYSLITLLFSLIILIGLSRIYLGVHYASDVVAGYCLSLGYLVVFTSVIGKVGKLNEKQEVNKQF